MPDSKSHAPMGGPDPMDFLFPPENDGKAEAAKVLSRAQRAADAKAAALLASRECPEDLTEWGRRHNIPEFARYTWQAGFLAGMRAVQLDAEIERVMALSDDEIRAEAIAEGRDIEAEAESMRRMFFAVTNKARTPAPAHD